MIRRWMSEVPFLDLLELRVPHPLLDRVLAGVAPAAEGLHGAPTCTTSPSPTRRASPSPLPCGAVCAGIELARRAPGRAAAPRRRGSPCRRGGRRPPGARRSACRTARATSRTRPRTRAPRGRARSPPRRAIDARAVEGSHEAVEALALVAEAAVLGQHPRPRGTSPRSRSPAGPSSASAAPNETPASPFSTTNAVMPRERGAGLDGGEDDVVVGEAAVRDPGLLAAQDVAAVGPRRRRRDRGGVRAGAGLGRGEGGRAADARRRAARASAAAAPRCRAPATGSAKKPSEVMRLPIPAQPQQSSSWTRHSRDAVGHAAAAVLLGEHEGRQPSSAALYQTSQGISCPPRRRRREIGRISRSANSRQTSRISRCSGVSP